MAGNIGERPRYTIDDVRAKSIISGLTPPLLHIEVEAITGMLNNTTPTNPDESNLRFDIAVAGSRIDSPLGRNERNQALYDLLSGFRLSH